MESDKIEKLLDKYFEGETSVAEENELRIYFSSRGVAQHLEQYKAMFGFFERAGQQQSQCKSPVEKKNYTKWISIAASAIILLSAGTFTYLNYNHTAQQGLGTYDNPEQAFRETQKALELLSSHVNTGVKSVQYIQTYENTKEKVFPDSEFKNN